MQAIDVVKGDVGFDDYLIDMLVEGSNGQVVSFTHQGQKKKGIVIGTKGEHIVVARGGEKHLVKNGQSQRIMEAEETLDDPMEELAPESMTFSQLDLVAEQIADGAVDLTDPRMLFELTGRQLRFLFATGAFKAGKAAAMAVRSSRGKTHSFAPEFRIVVRAKGSAPFSGNIKTIHPAERAAAKQAMQQQLRTYKALRAAHVGGLKRVPQEKLTGKPGSRAYLPMKTLLAWSRRKARETSREIAR